MEGGLEELTQRVVSLDDFRRAAQRLLRTDLFDYIDGGACDEVTKRANSRDFEAIRLAPLVFRDVANIDTLWSGPLGRYAVPIGLSPTALHCLVHERGEVAAASAARAAGMPMITSMMASQPIEEIAEGSGHEGLWLQVYLLKDRGLIAMLLERAERAGYKAVVVSAGCPVIGKRDRNIANGFSIPPEQAPANFPHNDRVVHNNPIHSFEGAALDPAATWRDLAWLAGRTRLPLLVKGIINSMDVRPALASGAAGLIVSNHGGRQLDGTISSIVALPEVLEAVAGQVPVLIDGGVRRGTDVLKAIALGADAVLLGSPILWALATGGEEGVLAALALLTDEFCDALRLVGCHSLSDLRENAAAILRRPG